MCAWLCVCPGGAAESACFARVSEEQPIGHAGQTNLLVHLQAAKLGRPNPSVLPQRDWRCSDKQVYVYTAHRQTELVFLYAFIAPSISFGDIRPLYCQTSTKLIEKLSGPEYGWINIPHASHLCSHTVSHIAKLFKVKGSDCWWELPIETLLPAEVLQKVSLHFFFLYRLLFLFFLQNC